MEAITTTIREAAEASIPKTDGYYKTCPVPWWNNKCKLSKKERKKAEKRMLRNPTMANKIEYKRTRGITKKLYNIEQSTSWNNYKTTINSKTPVQAVWNKAGKIAGKFTPSPAPTLKVNNSIISNQEEVAQTFADHFSDVSKATAMTHQDLYNKSKQKFKKISFNKGQGHQDNEYLNSPFTLNELQQCLAKCKDTAPGPDQITNSMLKHLNESSLIVMLTGINMLWESNSYPNSWREEIKLAIAKPNKNRNEVGSYRPISLTSCICKLFERMANTRLVWFMEKNNIISPVQSGFRKNKSTMDALAQLTSHVEKAFHMKKHTIAVFFDLEKAYDTVWRSEILNNIYAMGLRGNLPNFIQNFLTDRKFRVRVGASHSNSMNQVEGVPQGSVLSVTCFAIAINDIAKVLGKEVRSTLYVDDLSIYISATRESLSERLIQNAINKLEKWAKERGMKFSQDKTVAMKFIKRKKGTNPSLSLYGRQIKVVEHTRYLGLVVDSKLSWKQHVEYLREKCTSAMNLLRHLSGLSWSADRKSLLRIYTALVRSKLDYGCQFYSSAKPGILKRLDPIQNQCLRACTGAFRSSPATSLCVESGIVPLTYNRDIITLKHLFKIQAQTESPTYQATLGDPQENNPVKERLQSLSDKYSIPNPKIWENFIPETAPWRFPTIQVCPFLEVNKSSTPPEEMRSAFLQHKDEHISNHIYTDGSKMENHVGFAAVLPSQTTSGGLPKEASIFTAEIYAIKVAIGKLIENENSGNFTIFSDSQSVLLALQSNSRNSPMITDIQVSLYHAKNKAINVELCWVPSHSGIAGNEKADESAKNAAVNADRHLALRAIPHTDMTGPIKVSIQSEWQRQWASPHNQGNKLREIKPEIEVWNSSFHKNRRAETLLSRLRIGHTNITHSYLMERGTDPPMCDRCNTQITVKHILVESTKFTAIRRKYYNNPSVISMLKETNEFSINKLWMYLQEIDLVRKI